MLTRLHHRLHHFLYPNCRPAPHDDSPAIVRAVMVALGRERHHPGQAPMLVGDLVRERDHLARRVAVLATDEQTTRRMLADERKRHAAVWRRLTLIESGAATVCPVDPDEVMPEEGAKPAGPDLWFGEGRAAGDYDHGREEQTPCPYTSGTVGEHWWTRGYAYSARMLRAIEAEIAVSAKTEKPRSQRVVPEDRRHAIVAAVMDRPTPPTAHDIAFDLHASPAFRGLSLASIQRIVSDVAAEGWIVGDGRKPVRYSVPAASGVREVVNG